MNRFSKIQFRLPDKTIESLYIGKSVLSKYNKLLIDKKYNKVIVVIDKNVYKFYKDKIFQFILKKIDKNIIFVNPKPHYKDYIHASHIINKLIEFRANRKTCILAIGGGYVSDISGFVASIYMRGINFIQIPTTFMSMADPVIGKVAVNYKNYKNLIGSFYSPDAVFVDIDFLSQLPIQEIINGLVEVWKHSLLLNENNIIHQINIFLNKNSISDIANGDITNIINFSINAKKKLISDDYYDLKISHKALSLGHTLANHLERRVSIRHGEAVFYGIIFSAILSFNNKLIDKNKFQSIIKIGQLFEKYFKDFNKIKKIMLDKNFLNELKFDKINHADNYSFVLLTDDGFIVKKDFTKILLQKSIENYCNLSL